VALRLVLDSMVWAQAAGDLTRHRRGPAAEILHLAIHQHVVLIASSYIRAEVLGVLREEPYFRRKLAPTFDPGFWLDQAFAACAELIDVTGPAVLQAHAKDDPILWVAAAGGASHLVTWEQRLLDLTTYRFTRILTPAAFLRAWRNPEAHEPLPEWMALRRGPPLRPRPARPASAPALA
jgi:predicted nucleic acid-binding protein